MTEPSHLLDVSEPTATPPDDVDSEPWSGSARWPRSFLYADLDDSKEGQR